jgi:lactate dehydrogenase-like 2-hydroxyacid dehydrogenase
MRMPSGQRIKIAILDDFQDIALKMADWSPLQSRADITVFRDHLSDPGAVVRRLQPFDVVCVMRERTPLKRAILEQLPNLKLIASTAARNASIDLVAATERGITVCATGYSANGAAELTWALIMAAVRDIPAECASIRNGHWQVSVGENLEGKTIGVIGLGRIGSSISLLRYECNRLEPESHQRCRWTARCASCHEGRTVPRVRYRYRALDP